MISRRGLLRLMGVTATSLVVPGLWTPPELNEPHYVSWQYIYIPPKPEEPPVFEGQVTESYFMDDIPENPMEMYSFFRLRR